MVEAPLGFICRQIHARPFASGAVCFLAGILIADALPLIFWGVLAFAAILFAIFCPRYRRTVIFLLCLILGGARMQAAQTALPMVESQFSVPFSGVIVSDPLYDAEKERIICILKLNQVDGKSEAARVRLYLRSETLPLDGVEYGQTIDGFGHIWVPDAPTNPYQFNQQNWLKSSGLTGMAAAKLEDVTLSPAPSSPGRLVSEIRAAISDRISILFPKNPDLVRAFVLGDRSGLDDSLTDAFRDAGITHLICISGMHVSVLAIAVSLLLGAFLSRRTATIAAIFLVISYGALIGFPASLVRAAVMFAFFSASFLIGRPSDAVTRIAIALSGMLMVNPFYVLNAGFVLSFGATAGLILLDSPIEALLHIGRLKHRIPSAKILPRAFFRGIRYFPELLAATLAAQIAILPATIAYFGLQSPISIPANLLAVPLAMLAYPFAMASLIISAICLPAGVLLARIPDGMFSLLVSLAKFLSERAANGIQVPNYSATLILLHAVLCISVSDLTRIRPRVKKLLLLAIPMLACVSILIGWISSLGFGAVFLDAGQADSAMIHAGGHVYMIDTGDTYTPAADYAAATCVRLDAIFLSHPHRDHAGGLTRVLSKIRPAAIYVPEGWYECESDDEVLSAIALAEKMGIPIYTLCGGDELHLPGGIALNVVSPNPESESVNDCSQLLAFSCRGRTMLFTGDLSQAGEPDCSPEADVLKVPHHGSAKACSDEFLHEVSPEIAVISVGRDNSYGHPAAETLSRLENAECAIYRTDLGGAIFISVDRNGGMHARTFIPMEEQK